jgi:hypothetical protein
MLQTTQAWQAVHLHRFWKETSPGQHLLQIYESDDVLLNSLEGFAGAGLLEAESVIVIATPGHLSQLKERLSVHFSLSEIERENKFQGIDAQEMLKLFMRNGMPDGKLFMQHVYSVYHKALNHSKKVRAFGEMVAILTQQGNTAGAVALENLWNDFITLYQLTLFCAYPRDLVMSSRPGFLESICACHSTMIAGDQAASPEICHKSAF